MEEIKEIVSRAKASIENNREQQVQGLTSDKKCSECNGTGWAKRLEVSDYTRYSYDEIPAEIYYRCPKCSGQMRLEDYTGIPLQFRDADLSKFSWSIYENKEQAKKIHQAVSNFFQNINEWRKEGKGLYIWSNTSGSGKTFLACCLAQSIMIRYDIQMRFITVPDYFALLGEQMKAERGEYDKTKQYMTCDLLVLDDVGTTPNKEWYEMKLFGLLNYRMANGLLTIFTSNYQLEDLKLSDRLVDRIGKCGFPIRFPEEPIRKQKSDEDNRRFMEKMGLS